MEEKQKLSPQENKKLDKREVSFVFVELDSCQSNPVTPVRVPPGHAPSRIDGRGPAGNPNAALSQSHPARPDQQRPQPVGQISQSESVDQQSSQDVHLSKFCTHQRSAEKDQKGQRPAGKDQRPLEEDQSPAEDRIPLGKDQKNQNLAEKDQRTSIEDQTTAKKDHRPLRKDQKPTKKQRKDQGSADNDQRSVKKHHRSSETDQTKKDQRPAKKDQIPVKKKQVPAKVDDSPLKKNQTIEKDKKDHSPQEKDHSAPDEDHSPPEKDKKDHSPPVKDKKDHSPPEKDHSPPNGGKKDYTPQDKDHSPPEKDHSAPDKDHSPPEDKKDYTPQDKDHSPPEKDHSPPDEDHSPSEKDKKDYSPPDEGKKDYTPQDKHHSPPVDDHSSPQKDKKDRSPKEKDHNPSDKDHSVTEKEAKYHSPAKNEVKDHHPAKKDHKQAENDRSPSEKNRSPATKDQRPVEKQQKPSEQDKNSEEEINDSFEKHHKHQTPEEKDYKHQSPTEDQKDQSAAETRLMKNELDGQSISEHRKYQNALTEDSTCSKAEQPGPEDPPPFKLEKTPLDPCPSQQQKLESSSPTKTPQPKGQPNLLTPSLLSTDLNKREAFHQPKQEPGQQPGQGIDPDTKPELERKKSDQTLDQQSHEELEYQAEEQTELSQIQNQKKPPIKEQSVEKSPLPDLNTEQTLPDKVQQSNLAPPTKDSDVVPALALNIELFRDQVEPHPAVSSPSEPKLCGFLQKQGGPLKAWKQRWFTYEEKKNQLFYYRTPQDVMPLGQVELKGATFTYPLKAEKGTFHIKTPERTFILKAMSQELMLYWLQQLQIKRWHHRQNQSCTDPTSNSSSTNNNSTAVCADDFLPALKSPIGLVGEEAANTLTLRTPLTNVSIKHPLIELQNSVHSLRKRSSQELSQSMFYVDAPPRVEPGTTEAANAAVPSLPSAPSEPPTPTSVAPLADPAGQLSPLEGRESSSLFDSYRRKMKTSSMPTMSMRRKDSERTTRLLQENQMLMEEVKAQKELVWILHKALEASQLEKRTCAEFLSVDGEQERLELLRHRERQAADLRGKLEEAEATVEAAKKSAVSREAQVSELQKNIRMLTEKNNAKQEVIIKLSDQMTSYLSKPQRSCSPSCRDAQESVPLKQLQQEVENLKDDIEAYKIQNKFLNSEIYQLTKLWRTSSQQEKNLMVKCAHLEAINCQVESRYLGVLRQLQETKSLDPVQREAVQKMIEDALKSQMTSVLKLNPNRDYDEYGFKIVPDYEVEDMKLLAKIQALEIRSHNLLHQEAVERPLLSRWAQYLAGRSDQDLCPSLELKVLVRGGIPPEYRPRVWRWIVQARTKTIQDHHPQHYQQLCEKSRTSPHPASRQIQLDLHRTLTTNQNFSPSSPALQQLRRILLAFSWHNPAIGYCQGLNRLAAMALLVLQNEEDAFWCLVAVVESIMPLDYYTKSLVASQADQRVLKDFMIEKLPRLAAHFEEKNIDVSLVTFNWFLVVFVESLPSDILLPLWDAFLYEGTKVMFRYALALFKYKEEDILKISESVEIYQYLRFFTKTISDSRKLTNIAFNDMNPFPLRLLRNRRALHLDRLQGELHELEEQQKAFLTESAEHKDKDVDMAASEDDDDL
ncbi:TBC1 domain family member 2A [Salarias fasciatus]|uniref:TBC1 domain family member 2A-like n=1 Tax=Salarias fasciatus TaxID=181472 RepID=A0A672G8U6_SALFA|nr:TBC1 domain family member 2A-like [Salarias fasciatus]